VLQNCQTEILSVTFGGKGAKRRQAMLKRIIQCGGCKRIFKTGEWRNVHKYILDYAEIRSDDIQERTCPICQEKLNGIRYAMSRMSQVPEMRRRMESIGIN
tara:strand:+ start:6693 stop:6995 length:303 start_codon:yes stop_codon:yes gene_type:complete